MSSMIRLRQLHHCPAEKIGHHEGVPGGGSLTLITTSRHNRHGQVLPREGAIECVNDLSATTLPRNSTSFTVSGRFLTRSSQILVRLGEHEGPVAVAPPVGPRDGRLIETDGIEQRRTTNRRAHDDESSETVANGSDGPVTNQFKQLHNVFADGRRAFAPALAVTASVIRDDVEVIQKCDHRGKATTSLDGSMHQDNDRLRTHGSRGYACASGFTKHTQSTATNPCSVKIKGLTSIELIQRLPPATNAPALTSSAPS